MLFTNFGALVLALGPRPESNVEQFLITESSVAKQHKTDFKLFYLTQKMYLVNMLYDRVSINYSQKVFNFYFCVF